MTMGSAKVATVRQRTRNPSGAALKGERSGAPEAGLRLKLLGRFELIGPDGPIDLGARKLCGLLALLACTEPEPQPRERLMTLFWGSHFDAQARQNLRKALSRLRHALGEHVLVTNEDSVSLRAGIIQCDVARFEGLIADGSYDALVAAADCYKGPLVSDLSISQEPWNDWANAQRRRLEDLLVDALVRLAGEEEKQGNVERALELAKRAVVIDPLREDAHRTIMRTPAASGRKADALKHYEEVAALLKRELDVEPDAATATLAVELRKPQGSGLGSFAREALPLPGRPSIAVLPFANMSGDSEQDYFADGIVEDILSALSRVRWLFVIARHRASPTGGAPST